MVNADIIWPESLNMEITLNLVILALGLNTAAFSLVAKPNSLLFH